MSLRVCHSQHTKVTVQHGGVHTISFFSSLLLGIWKQHAIPWYRLSSFLFLDSSYRSDVFCGATPGVHSSTFVYWENAFGGIAIS